MNEKIYNFMVNHNKLCSAAQTNFQHHISDYSFFVAVTTCWLLLHCNNDWRDRFCNRLKRKKEKRKPTKKKGKFFT